MNRKLPALVSLLLGAAFASSAAPLLFTNITSVISPGSLTAGLKAVAYGGNSNFVAVGDGGTFLRGRFVTNFIASYNWTSNTAGASFLSAVASEGINDNRYVIAGRSNLVFTSTNGVNWITNSAAFPNTANAASIAYNNGVFAMVATAPAISWSTNGTNWNLAHIDDLSFLESYRAVTPYGNSEFAACGILGTVRLSTSRGTNWHHVFGGIGQPDLLGIATTHGTNLVAVGKTAGGKNGVILVSTNNGVNWTTNYTNPSTNTPLNAVASSAINGFVAVGNGGQILTSSNGVVWTKEPPGLTANDLFGVAFAGRGLMKEVCVLTGDKGTIILGGTPPDKSTDAVAVTNCAHVAGITNPPNSVTVSEDANHPLGALTVDWFSVTSSGTNLVTNLVTGSHTNTTSSGSLIFTLTTTDGDPGGDNAPAYYVYYARTRDLRTDFTSGLNGVTNQINPRPTAALRPFDTTVCNYGSNYVFTVDLTGIGPWTVTWNDGTVQTNTNVGSGPATLLRTVYPTNAFAANTPRTNVYYVTRVVNTDTGCEGNQPGDITGTNTVIVDPRPTAMLRPFDTTVCNYGSNFVFTVDLTGIGPWKVTWNDGTVQTNTNVGSGPAALLRTVYPTNAFGANTPRTNDYYVTSVVNTDTGCEGNQPGDITGTNVVIVNPRPTAKLRPFETTVCNYGSNFVFTVDLTGIGPWRVTWNDGTVQTNTNVGSGPDTLLRTVYPTNAFAANGPRTNVYYVTSVVNTNTGCEGNQPGDITGTNVVIVNPRPTAKLRPFDTTVCNYGSNYVFTVDLTGIGPWRVTWNDGTVQTNTSVGSGPVALLRTVYPTNASGVCTQRLNVYYVTNVVDANACLGNQLGDITGTNTVTVNPRPTSTLTSLDRTNCNNGSSYTITSVLTGYGPWIIAWSDGTWQTNYSTECPATNTYTVYPTNTILNRATNLTYSVTNLTDLYCVADPSRGDLTGTNTVTVNANLVVYGPTPQTECSGNVATFSVTAFGTPTNSIVYQWMTNGVALTNGAKYAGVTNATLFVTNVTAELDDLTNYAVRVQSECGDITNYASLTVSSNISVLTSPSDQTVCGRAGLDATFKIGASGSDLAYQWWSAKNGDPNKLFQTKLPNNMKFSGATSSSLTISNVGGSDRNFYTVVVTNSCGGKITNTAFLTVDGDVSITSLPDQAACIGSVATFSAETEGSVGEFKWRTNGGYLTEGAKYAGVTSATLYITNVLPADALTYTLEISSATNARCTGHSDTNNATLTVLTNVSAIGPTNQTACPGDTASFSVAAVGSGVTYSWMTNGVTLTDNDHYAGVATTTLYITNVTTDDALTYAVWVHGQCGDVTNSAMLTVNPLAVGGTATPTSATVTNGGSTNITLTGYIGSIQWQQSSNGTNGWANVIGGSGATTDTYTTPGLTDTTYYRALVTTVCSTTNSTTATVNISTANLGLLRIRAAAGTSGRVVVSWVGDSWLQSADSLAGPWSNVVRGTALTTNYWTNSATGSCLMFRLRAPTQ